MLWHTLECKLHDLEVGWSSFTVRGDHPPSFIARPAAMKGEARSRHWLDCDGRSAHRSVRGLEKAGSNRWVFD